jgi:hypothetical protein
VRNQSEDACKRDAPPVPTRSSVSVGVTDTYEQHEQLTFHSLDTRTTDFSRDDEPSGPSSSVKTRTRTSAGSVNGAKREPGMPVRIDSKGCSMLCGQTIGIVSMGAELPGKAHASDL